MLPPARSARRQPPVSNRAQALRPAGSPPPRRQPVSSRVAIAQQAQPNPISPARPVSQRAQTTPLKTGQQILNAGMGAAKAYGEYTIGFYEGVGSSLKNTWDFVTHDAWQAKTWTEMGTTMVAITLMSGPGANHPIAGHLNAQWLDKHLGTEFAQRQVQIVMALDQAFRDMPNWKARQWGKVVGRLAGDVLTTKGAGAAAKTGFRIVATEVQHVQTITKLTGSVQQAVPVYGRFTAVRAKIPFADVRTPKSSAAFWSGLEEGSEEAARLARATGRTSLEMTPGGVWLDGQTKLLGNQVDWFGQMRPQWARLSRRFAQQTRGSVKVFRGPDLILYGAFGLQ